MPQNLTDQHIDETFAGLLHSQGAELPATNQVDLYDGVGNKSALKLGRENYGATIYAGANDASFTVIGDMSATGRTVAGHMEALQGSTAPNIPKAFVTFFGNDGGLVTNYGVDSVERTSAGIYKINLSDITSTLLGNNNYNIQVSMTIDDADFNTSKMYCAVANSNSTNGEVYIRCIRDDGTTKNYFEPRHVHVTILKN